MTRVRRRRWVAAGAVALLVAAAGVLLALAPELGMARAWGIAALLPARDAVTVGVGALALVCVGLALWHPSRPIAAPLAIALLIVSAFDTPGLFARGLHNPAPAPATAGQLRVLEWNTNGDLVDPAVIAALAAREHANVVVLPEANIAFTAPQYRSDFAAAGAPMTVFAAPSAGAQAAVMMTDALAADYRQSGAGPDVRKTLVLTPTVAGLPRIVALHAPHPVGGNTGVWRATLDWVTQQCGDGAVLVAGDFNASIDNFGGPRLGACEDVASEQRAGSVGTWPTKLPTPLAMPIDHVLTTRGAGVIESFTVLTGEDRSGARHRPTLTVLQAAG